MPDHIHFFVGENHAARYQLANWIAAWKTFVSLRWPTPKDKPILAAELLGSANS
jgi:hypothetical protein